MSDRLPSTSSSSVSSCQKRSSDAVMVASKRRRMVAQSYPTTSSVEVIDLTADSPPSKSQNKSAPSKRIKKSTTLSSPLAPVAEEKRLKRFRSHPPKTFVEKYQRAITQRMFVVHRELTGTPEDPQMRINVIGTTGNIYTVTMQRTPICNCPDGSKGNHCKHIIYVLVNVSKARGPLEYQAAYLTSELRELFDNAPIEPEEHGDISKTSDKRRPIEGDCPICYMEFDPDKEKIVWCETCGNNIHEICFNKWAATNQARGVRCVFCRAEWPVDNIDPVNVTSLIQAGNVNEEGYVNVASMFGLSGERDYSSYHSTWENHRYGGHSRRQSWF